MRTTLLLLALLSGPVFAAGQTVWKWVDANGVTHYTDRPVPGATRMELATGSPVAASPPATAIPSSSSDPAPADTGPVYRDLEIWKPANDETIQNSGGQVTVNLRVQPDVQPGHTLSLYLDGRLVEGSGNGTSFELRDVQRGGHTLVAVITDQRGNRIQESSRVAFYVQQQSIAQPPVGPALRPPPPKPQPRAGNKMLTSQPTYAALNPAEPPAPKIDPATNRPVTKPTAKPSTPKSGS